ncbi:pentapeptide repeat-containing protein [Streptomyces sp. NPDC058294]|uniref:pentapeptide repeat-containing protein n=1 Tax=Streptomyces sp. NPDC058294 TaxID=3346430 RepID=UPI0036EEBE5D
MEWLGVRPWEWGSVLAVLLVGLALFLWASIRPNTDDEPWCARKQIIGNLGGGILSAGIISLALLAIQSSLQSTQDETTWRDSLASAPNLAGFNPGRHSVKELTLIDKDLHDALLDGRDLTGTYLNGSILRGAHLAGAILENANMQGADLSTADLSHADLAGADLRSANLAHATIWSVQSLEKAKVNAQTCWPKKTFRDRRKLMEGVQGFDASGHPNGDVKGREFPTCPKR